MQSSKFLILFAGFAGLLLLSQCAAPQNEGQRLYTQNCANCHMDDGSGLRNLIPPLAGADYLEKHRHDLACLIKHGQSGPIVVNGVLFNKEMPAHEHLSAIDIQNLLNYIQKNFAKDIKPFSPEEVNRALEKCKH